MTRSGKTAQEFIQNCFSPIVAVLCSPKVEIVVSKNNLSFTELLQPFTGLSDWEGQFREPGGSVCIVKNWKLIIRDVNWKPLQPTEARRQLNNAVLYNYNDKMVPLDLESRKLEVPQATNWFDSWRETYFDVQFPSDHEFTKHFLSCIFVCSTYDDNVIDTINGLNQQYVQLQNVTPPKLPKWFNNDILKSYLLLHDVAFVSKEKADTAFETMKQNYGTNNCFMLAINSKTNLNPSLPNDIWTKYIKRTTDSNNELSSVSSTPLEPQPPIPSLSSAVAEDPNKVAVYSSTEGSHPLNTAENDVYDNANSLQTHSFSGSTESVSISGKELDYSNEVHGAALNSADVDAIKKFLQEYASKALLPHLEKQISLLSEGVANRKGVSRSLISATKRWFGTGKTGNATISNTVIYSGDCQELQLRRLGDLWFLCGQWQKAFDSYHTAKREFYADSAWLCYAGALEMAALSAFMAGDANKKTHGYMEESIVTYLNTCRMVQYAVRATLLSVLCLSNSGLHGEAAKQLIRMTSEDSDLRSAMLLEQAALCFLAGPGTKAMTRKYAFHIVLAGHRFSKAGQKKHAYRCYKQAYQIYESSGWRLATDHVQFALGRLAGALRGAGGGAGAAERWLRAPLAPRSPHPPAQQAAFLREYVQAHQQWIQSAEYDLKDRLPVLPLPLLELESTSVLCVGPAPLSSPGRVPATSLNLTEDSNKPQYWSKMEEMLLQVAQGSVPMIFKPTVDLYTVNSDTSPVVPQGEPIQISITLYNPLKISLILKDIELLWQFTPIVEDSEFPIYPVNNEPYIAKGKSLETNYICGQKIQSVLMEPECKKNLHFAVTPLHIGNLSIQGIAYKLVNVGESSNANGETITGKLDLFAAGKKILIGLQLTVISPAPCLQMTFLETNTDVYSGELQTIDVEFRNVGPIDMKNIYIAVSHPDCATLVTPDSNEDDFDLLFEEKYKDPSEYSDDRARRAATWRAAARRHVWRGAGGAAAGGCVRAALLLRPRTVAPASPASHASPAAPAQLALLAYYETGNPARPYRLLRHVFNYNITEAVELSITPRRSMRAVDGQLRENMNLAVEVKNVINDKEGNRSIEILEASLLSRQWKLTDLIKARNKDELLGSHERVHLIFKGIRILENVDDGKVEYSRLKVATSQDSLQDINEPPYSKFLVEYKKPYLDNPDAQLEEKPSKGLIQSLFVLRWKLHNKKGRSAIGQHCLWMDCLSKTESKERQTLLMDTPSLHLEDYDSRSDLFEGKKKKQNNVVVYRFEHPDSVSHNFNERKLCLVPITINIVNCYNNPVQVFIDMSKKPARDSFSLMGWAGALSNGTEGDGKDVGVSVSLDKLESRRVVLGAVVAAPGAYALAAICSVTTQCSLTQAIAQTPLLASHADDNSTLLRVHAITV